MEQKAVTGLENYSTVEIMVDKLYWGGTKYSGLYGGPKWLPGFDKPIKYYVPSIAISACLIYKGKEFKEWNGDALVVSLKDMSLRKIKFSKNKFLKEEIIFKDKIGRLRDIKLLKKWKTFIINRSWRIMDVVKNLNKRSYYGRVKSRNLSEEKISFLKIM